jgi:soluble lytic murein transglycosylase-like protein
MHSIFAAARSAFVLLAYMASLPASACWEQAAQRHGVPADLLYAIASIESGLNPKAVNRSHFGRTDSYDIGLMQINSRHLPKLARHGITESRLYEPCINLDVGAWMLSELFARRGVSWDSVGAYNAACTQLKGEACSKARARYAWKVFRKLPSVRRNTAARQSVPSLPAAGAAPLLLAVRVSP